MDDSIEPLSWLKASNLAWPIFVVRRDVVILPCSNWWISTGIRTDAFEETWRYPCDHTKCLKQVSLPHLKSVLFNSSSFIWTSNIFKKEKEKKGWVPGEKVKGRKCRYSMESVILCSSRGDLRVYSTHSNRVWCRCHGSNNTNFWIKRRRKV